MVLRRILFIIMFVLLGTANAQRIAIMGAMDEEIELLKVGLEHKKEIHKNGITFFTGELKGQKVVLLKAGIGKTNAAYSTAILTANFKLKALIFYRSSWWFTSRYCTRRYCYCVKNDSI